MSFSSRSVAVLATAVLPLFFGLAQAQTLILDGDLRVTDADIQAVYQKAPAELRKRTLSRPEAVQQQAENLLVRRKLAQQARAAGTEKDPLVQALVNVAVDRVLSDIWLEQFDRKSTPDDATLEKAARAAYIADPQRFAKPAQIRASHILIKKETPKAREVAEGLLAELKKGANFEELAQARSDDPGSAARGGSLGVFGAGRMVKPFEEAAFALKNVGDVSDVVETQFGFHVIRLDERIAAGAPAPFDEVKRQLMAEAKARALTEARNTLQAQLLESAKPQAQAIEAFSATQR